MRKSLVGAFAVCVSVVVCLGCQATSETKEPKAPEAQQQTKKEPELTEQEISQIVATFPGVGREHAAELWKADKKWKQATAEFRAYWDSRRRFNKNDPALLSGTIRTHREAKKILDPLCSLYPHNTPLNSMDEDITRGLHSLLEAQRLLTPSESEKSK